MHKGSINRTTVHASDVGLEYTDQAEPETFADASPVRDPDVDEVKRRIRRARARLGLSQREVARRAHVSKSVIEKYESRDDRRIPNTKQLFRLAIVFGLSIDYLVGRTERPLPETTKTDGSYGRERLAMAGLKWQRSF